MAIQKVGWRPYVSPLSSLLTSIYGVWNGDTTTTTLATGAYGAWNGEGTVTATQLVASSTNAWNGEALGTSLDSNIFRVYNGDNVNDSSGNTQNGTNVGGVTFTTGKVGNAFTFNGSNYINLPSASLNSLTGDFSVSFWMNLQGVGADAQFPVGNFYYDGTNLYGWDVFIASSSLNFQIFNGTSNVSINTLTTGIGSYYYGWNLFTIVRKGSTSSKIYINGALVASNTNTTNPVHHASSSATIGARKFDSTVQYNMANGGKLDAVTIWNKTLTDSEVLSLYNTGTGAEYPYSSLTLPSSNDVIGTNHGTLTNGCTFTTGKIGNAFLFDGVNDYVELGTNSLNFTGDFSVSLWANFNSVGAVNQYLIDSTGFGTNTSPQEGTSGWMLYYFSGYLYFNNYNDNSNVQLSTTVINTANTWYHIVISSTSSGMSMYVNGTLITSNTTNQRPNYRKTVYPRIGTSRSLNNNFSGKIDAITTWTKGLTQDEVFALYNSGSGQQYPFSSITVASPKDSVSTNNGTIVGGVTYTTGVIGNAFSFNGSTGYITYPNDTFKLTGNFSINTWVKLNAIGSTQAILSSGTLTSNGFRMYVASNNKVNFEYNGSYFTGTTTLAANTWYNIVLVNTGSVFKLYINGTLDATNASFGSTYQTITWAANGTNLAIAGRYITSAYFMNGAIDATTVWTKALTDDEVTQLYNMGGGIQYPFTTQTIKTPYSVYNGDSLVDPIGAKNATISGGVTYTTGKIGNAYTFNGTNASLSLPVGSMSFQGTSFSFSMWLKFNGTPSNYATILSNCIMANYKGFIFGNNGGGLYFQLGNGTSTWITLGGPAVSNFVNTWGLVTVVWEQGVGAKMYMNGVLASSVANTTTPDFSTITANPVVGVGNGGSGWPYLNGSIDGLTFWNSALTYPEIATLYNAGAGMEYPYSSSIPAVLPSASDAYGSNTGTLMNGCTFTPGKIGRAFSFDGVNDYVNFPTDFFKPVSNFSANFWINTNNATTTQTIFTSVASNGYLGWRLFISGGVITFRTFPINTTFNELSTSGSTYTASNWHMITIINDISNGMKIYVNGVQLASNTIKQAISWGSTTINKLGQNYDNGTVFNGKIDAMTLWSKALTSTEVTELYNSGTGKQYPNY